MRSPVHDLRDAVRSLARQPLVGVVAVASLALGIGANTAIFTLWNAVLLHPVPAAKLDRLVTVYTVDQRFSSGPRGAHHPTSFPNFEDLRDHGEVFTHTAAFFSTPLAFSHETPEEVTGQLVSSDFFDLMGLEPAHGRFFSAEENGPRIARPVTVLSDAFWRGRFGGDPGTVGRKVRLNGQPFEVIGVAPAGFIGADLTQTPDLWVPLMLHDQLLTGAVRLFFGQRRALLLGVVGRLRDGVTPARAESSLAVLARTLAERHPDDNRDRGVTVVPLARSNLRPDQRALFARAGAVLLGVVGVVLVIVCVNVAHLLLVRAERRRTEIALRLALGASRRDLARQLLAEGFVLAAAGAAFGLVVARWGRDALWSLRPPILENAHPDLGFDATVLAFTAAVALGTALVAGLAPVLGASRVGLASVLRDARPIAGQSRLLTARGGLVVLQVALSMAALTVSGLFLRSLGRATEVDPGFAHAELGVLAYNLGTLGYDQGGGLDFHRRVLATAAALPEVEGAALATNRPLNPLFSGVLRTVVPEGLDPADPANGRLTHVNTVSAGYLEAMGIPLASGRGFTGADRDGSRRVAVVNETMARVLWPGEDALGRRLLVRGVDGPAEVVGVARDSLYEAVGQEPVPYLYLALEQGYNGRAHLFVRTAAPPSRVIETVRRKVRELDPELPLTHVTTMDEELAGSLWALRLGALLLGGFGVLATVLASVGIWGVMAYAVSLRHRELGIRAALGAEPGAVLRMVLAQGMAWAGAGVVLGGVLTVLSSGLLSRLLFGLSATDPLTFAATAAVLAAVALLANLAPALQATAADPMSVLRSSS